MNDDPCVAADELQKRPCVWTRVESTPLTVNILKQPLDLYQCDLQTVLQSRMAYLRCALFSLKKGRTKTQMKRVMILLLSILSTLSSAESTTGLSSSLDSWEIIGRYVVCFSFRPCTENPEISSFDRIYFDVLMAFALLYDSIEVSWDSGCIEAEVQVLQWYRSHHVSQFAVTNDES
jgi:hypothetical protein